MPTERFEKLRKDKKRLITEAVVREFQRTSYGELLISNIARNAHISRASIYTYFHDKEDIFRFAVMQTKGQRDPYNISGVKNGRRNHG